MRLARPLLLLMMTALVLGVEKPRDGLEGPPPPSSRKDRLLARDFFESTLAELEHQRLVFARGFGNATALLRREYDAADQATGEARGKKKQLKRINRTLLAIVMAYTLKFMFLIPTFIGTLVLFKFTAALAGFFYALFAAVLGLDHHQHSEG